MSAGLSWSVIGSSIRGASHFRNGAPNQDALGWREGETTIVAVADGHGSSECFRSDKGAAFAVRCVLDLFSDRESREPDGERIGEELVQRWETFVAAELAESPLSPEESKRKLTATALRRLRDRPSIAYGSTVLAAAASSTHLFCLQLGDGDILFVSHTGEVRRPWPPDARLIGGETTSLCMQHAAREMRFILVSLDDDAPELVLLATDGYANSFRDNEGFMAIGKDILDSIRQDGLPTVESNLSGWLNEASQCGSGDDITLGILYRSRERD